MKLEENLSGSTHNCFTLFFKFLLLYLCEPEA